MKKKTFYELTNNLHKAMSERYDGVVWEHIEPKYLRVENDITKKFKVGDDMSIEITYCQTNTDMTTAEKTINLPVAERDVHITYIKKRTLFTQRVEAFVSEYMNNDLSQLSWTISTYADTAFINEYRKKTMVWDKDQLWNLLNGR
ncbi:MAG: hypothetical protein Tp1124SUR1244132_20 [Prokaryotic dsDNA virus sp.]|nr:MAG: hypothetical protein Tp1124SUR1244132_20 [Prokaryotic dsDNA virus sp.]